MECWWGKALCLGTPGDHLRAPRLKMSYASVSFFPGAGEFSIQRGPDSALAPHAHHGECLQAGVRVYVAVGWGGPGCTERWCPRRDKSHGLFDFLTKLSGYLQDGWCLCDLTPGQITPRPTVDLFPTVPSGWGSVGSAHLQSAPRPGGPLTRSSTGAGTFGMASPTWQVALLC